MLNTSLKKYGYLFLVISIIVFYFSNTDIIISAVKEGLVLCYETIIPSLYIFMILSILISSTVFSDIIATPFYFLFRLLNIQDKKIAAYCVLSMLGGFAMGGYFFNRINNEYKCSKNINVILSILISNNSPAFIIVAVGLQMLGSIKTGIIIYISVIVSCYITAFILSFMLPYNDVERISSSHNTDANISEAIKISVNSILTICGTVIFATSLCKVVQLYTHFPIISAIFTSFIEVTTACNYISQNISDIPYLICIALTILPLSAYFQIKSFDTENVLNFKILYLSKLFQIPLCISIFRILINIFPQAYQVYSNTDIKVNLYWNSPHMSCYLFIISIFFVIFFDRKIGVFTKTDK